MRTMLVIGSMVNDLHRFTIWLRKILSLSCTQIFDEFSKHFQKGSIMKKFYLFKRSNGIYYMVWYEGNRRVWRSTKCQRKSDAFAYLKEFDLEQAILTTERQLRLSEFIENYSGLFSTNIRTSTLRS